MTDPMADLEEQVAKALFAALFPWANWDKGANPPTLGIDHKDAWRKQARAAIAVCQASWANEKAEMERQLAVVTQARERMIDFINEIVDEYGGIDYDGTVIFVDGAGDIPLAEYLARWKQHHASLPAKKEP